MNGTGSDINADDSDDISSLNLSDVNNLLSDFIPHEDATGEQQTQLTTELFEMIREHLLAVEGIKVDTEPVMFALAITWMALKKHVRIPDDITDPTFVRILQELGQLHEQMTDSAPVQNTKAKGADAAYQALPIKRIVGRSVFLWLSLGYADQDRNSESHHYLSCDEFFTFLSLEESDESTGSAAFLDSFCEALKHLRWKEELLKRSTPYALKVLKETKRLKALTTNMPLTVALLTDEVRKQRV